MAQQLYSVEQVAEQLGLHVRTVRNYVRDGRLKATRIGKQYRISREDLEAFTGRRDTAPAARRVEVSTIVQLDAVGPELMHRLTTLLVSAAGSRDADATRLHVTTDYDEERGSMKIIMLGGGTAGHAELLRLVDALLGSDGH